MAKLSLITLLSNYNKINYARVGKSLIRALVRMLRLRRLRTRRIPPSDSWIEIQPKICRCPEARLGPFFNCLACPQRNQQRILRYESSKK
jgi:hypothetical protein